LLANTGNLDEPVNARNVDSKQTPQGNFAHDAMTTKSESVNGQNVVNGVLGRMLDALSSADKRTASFTIRGASHIQRGKTEASSGIDYVSQSATVTLNLRFAIDSKNFTNVLRKLSSS
jgi:hypothetical protein